MSHRHWCDYAGHYWECLGTAVRVFEPEPSVCMCLDHGIPMDEGDHTGCRIELLSCPVHHTDQMLAMGYEPDYVIPPASEGCEQKPLFVDADGNRTVGFCLWCGRDFYSIAAHDVHVADNMAECAAFQRLKDETFTPPALEHMFENAGLVDLHGEDHEA